MLRTNNGRESWNTVVHILNDVCPGKTGNNQRQRIVELAEYPVHG
jgi:hypothetical protein